MGTGLRFSDMNKKKRNGAVMAAFTVLALMVLMIMAFPGLSLKAADAKEVTIGDVDYDQLTMKVYKNGNTIVYFSSDSRKTWNEVEGESGKDSVKGDYILMDISWAQPKSEVTVYLKGNKETTVLEAVFPKANTSFKAKLDKAANTVEFENAEGAEYFLWRKSTDSDWQRASFKTTSETYIAFSKVLDALKLKGGKVLIACDQVVGTGADSMGERISNTFTISVSKIANAPSVKLNVKKMTLNTKETQEYYDEAKKAWVSCSKNMTVAEIAPQALFNASKSGETVRIKIRVAATEKKSASKVTVITIPGQNKAPDFGEGGAVKYGFTGGKLVVTFMKASAAEPIEYCVVKQGTEFDATKVSWKTIKAANKPVKLSEKSVPDGSRIYIRYAGVAANEKKNISLKLPSYYNYDTITWPAKEEKTEKTDTKTNK